MTYYNMADNIYEQDRRRRVNNSQVMPDQRTSHKQKMNPKWYIPMANHIVKLAASSSDMYLIRNFYRMANGEVPSEDGMRIVNGKMRNCNTNPVKKGNSITNLRRIDFSQPIMDKYLGEFVSSYNNMMVHTNDPDQVLKRNKAFAAKVMPALNQKMINALNEQMQQGSGEESIDEGTIKSLYDKFVKEWDAERNEAASNRLALLESDLELKRKYEQSYYDFYATQCAFTRRTLNGQHLELHSIPADEYYRIPSGNFLVEDDMAGVWIHKMQLGDILDKWGDEISATDASFLRGLYSDSNLNAQTRIALLSSRNIELSQMDSTNNSINSTPFPYVDVTGISVVEYDYVTEVPAKEITYIDANGETSIALVDEDYELDIEGGDISEKTRWVQRVYTGAIIGADSFEQSAESIYVKPKPLVVQRELFSNTNRVKLSFNGFTGTHPKKKLMPIPYRINDYLALYRVIMHRVESAIYSWKSFVILPQAMFMDNMNQIAEERITRLNEQGILLHDTESKAVTPASYQAIKEVATTATHNFVTVLREFAEDLKNQAWEEANVNESRMGNTSPYQGKGVTENNARQQMISSNWDISVFNYFKCADQLATYDWSRVAWADGKEGEIYLPDKRGTMRVVVDPIEHLSTNIGIVMTDDAQYKEKLGQLKELAFAAGQNGNFEIGVEAVTNDNLKGLGNRITELVEEERKYNERMEELKQANAKEIMQMQNEAADKLKEFELDKLYAELENNIAVVNAKTEGEIRVWETRMKIDTDGNGHITEEERRAYDSQNSIANYKKQQDMIKQSHKESEDALNRRDKRIAELNKKSSKA